MWMPLPGPCLDRIFARPLHAYIHVTMTFWLPEIFFVKVVIIISAMANEVLRSGLSLCLCLNRITNNTDRFR